MPLADAKRKVRLVHGEPEQAEALLQTLKERGFVDIAYPQRGDSAINKMVNAIAEINAASWGEDDVLGKTTVNVGVVRGGEKPNIIAGSAECQMMFRTVGDPEAVRRQLEGLLAKYGGVTGRLPRCTLRSTFPDRL